MKIFRYETTDSTNTRAREYARCGSPEIPALFIADRQSEGRGRRGRSFESEKGGLYATLLFSPERSGNAVFITIRAAVALARAIRTLSGLVVGIKWVNDLFVNGRKLAGILAEGVEFDGDGNLKLCALGFGVNLARREFSPEIADIVTTLEDECGAIVDRDALCLEFVNEFLALNDGEVILSEYRALSVVLGRTVEVRKLTGEVFTATALDISDTGALIVQSGDEVEELISAEVSIKI